MVVCVCVWGGGGGGRRGREVMSPGPPPHKKTSFRIQVDRENKLLSRNFVYIHVTITT